MMRAKIFIRQKINVSTKTSTREVVDGQQRLRTILSYINDGFEISKRHNREYGGLRFSQLPEDVQAQLLSYELAVDLLINMPDAEVLDIFGRLNSYAVVLNEQERINATHFGPFKILADNIGRKYAKYWTDQRILTPAQILRMQEVNLVADLLIAMIDGIKSKKRIKRYYAEYERKFDSDSDVLAQRFDKTIQLTTRLYPEGLPETEFRRVHLFYSLFTSVYHCLEGLAGLDIPRVDLSRDHGVSAARNGLERVEELFEAASAGMTDLNKEEAQFIQDSRRATTDEVVRARRTKFLVTLMS